MYDRLYSVPVDPDRQVLPLLGSKEGIFHLAQAYIQPGDVVLAPDPGYITYIRGAQFAGGDVHCVPLLEENDYLPDLEAIPAEALERAKLMWLNYPSNPTAALAPLAFFEQVVAFARQHSLLVCHDAAYAQVTFTGQPAPSILQVPGASEVAVEFTTLSKSHNMAGWRTAALVGNPDAVRTLFALKTNTDSSHFLPVMDATIAALQGDQSWIQGRNREYRLRRDVILEALEDLGLTARTPLGSMYIWAQTPPGYDSARFAAALLDEAHLSLTPGIVFGEHGEGYVRIAFTSPVDRTIEGMQRLKRWMEAR